MIDKFKNLTKEPVDVNNLPKKKKLVQVMYRGEPIITTKKAIKMIDNLIDPTDIAMKYEKKLRLLKEVNTTNYFSFMKVIPHLYNNTVSRCSIPPLSDDAADLSYVNPVTRVIDLLKTTYNIFFGKQELSSYIPVNVEKTAHFMNEDDVYGIFISPTLVAISVLYVHNEVAIKRTHSITMIKMPGNTVPSMMVNPHTNIGDDIDDINSLVNGPDTFKLGYIDDHRVVISNIDIGPVTKLTKKFQKKVEKEFFNHPDFSDDISIASFDDIVANCRQYILYDRGYVAMTSGK